MLSALPSDPLLEEIVRRVIFSAFTGALWLLLAIVVLRLFVIKNPAVKHVFYTLALAKGFVALIREQPIFVQTRGPLAIGLQFPSPFSILPDLPDLGTQFFLGSSTFASGPGLTVLTTAMIFLAWRFFGLARFYRIINKAPKLDRIGNKRFYVVLDRLVKQAQVVSPRVILLNSTGTPFTVGLKRPIIALSPWLLKHLDEEEIEAVLAHEVGHIVRRDYLFHWPIVIMRDVLFFNPLTYFVYGRLSFERERACDDFSAELSRPLTLAKVLLKVVEARRAEPALGIVKSYAPQSLHFAGRKSNFSRRVIGLTEPKAYGGLTRLRRAFLWLGVFIFLYAEIHVIAKINGTHVVFS